MSKLTQFGKMGIDDFNELKLKMDDFQSKIHQFLIKNNQDLATKSETYWNSESEKIKKIEALKDKLRQLEEHQISLEEGMFKFHNVLKIVTRELHRLEDFVILTNVNLNFYRI